MILTYFSLDVNFNYHY